MSIDNKNTYHCSAHRHSSPKRPQNDCMAVPTQLCLLFRMEARTNLQFGGKFSPELKPIAPITDRKVKGHGGHTFKPRISDTLLLPSLQWGSS